MPNTAHFACFDCRKGFKQRGSSTWDSKVPERPFPCPDCSKPMARFGRYFKTPRKDAPQQWLKVELLYQYGQRFGGDRTGTRDEWKTLGRTIAHLSAEHGESAVRKKLAAIRKRHTWSRT